jgi:hypothetical protein
MSSAPDARHSGSTVLPWRSLAAVVLASFGLACQEARPVITVYKTPTCGCCAKWVEHMQAAGFEVSTVDLRSLDRVKAEQGVPVALSACHTAIVDGYVVEGHVPAADVERLLETRPPVRGLAVAGMPIGSPGMEGPHPERYTVHAFDARGRTTSFATHGP